MAEEPPRTIYQPIHPSIRSRLVPEYVAFHEKYLHMSPHRKASLGIPHQGLCQPLPPLNDQSQEKLVPSEILTMAATSKLGFLPQKKNVLKMDGKYWFGFMVAAGQWAA
jgi:hypothetical protein